MDGFAGTRLAQPDDNFELVNGEIGAANTGIPSTELAHRPRELGSVGNPHVPQWIPTSEWDDTTLLWDARALASGWASVALAVRKGLMGRRA